MSDRDHSAFVFFQMLLEPHYTFSIEVISWFIEKENVRFLKK